MKSEPLQKPKLTVQELNYCFIHMLRSPELFAYVKQHLKPQHFNGPGEAHYALLWSATLAAAARNNGVLPQTGADLIIAMDINSKADESPHTFTAPTVQLAIDFLAWIYAFENEKLNPDYYKQLLQNLIVERTIVGEMTKDISEYRDGRPLDIVKSLEEYSKKLQVVLTADKKTGATAFPKDFKPKKLGKFSTGHEWLDKYMNGGQAPGEVYVMLGPSGLGKTTQGVMIATQTARVWNKMYKEEIISKPRISCFFSWEQDCDRLRLRFWSYAAEVDSTRLELYADEAIELSTTGKLESYEFEDFKDEIRRWGPDKFPGEKERLAAAAEELNEIVRIYDFSGADDENPHAGEGGIDEIAQSLRQLQKDGKEIGVVIIDYANLAVRRMLAATGEDPSHARHYLSNFCNECRFKIAIPFNCPVWVMNQLNTEANRRAPTAEQHHSFASECGNFAENAWFAFVFSTKDKANNTCRLYCTKERRAKGDRPPVIFKIEGNYCRMVEAVDYAADEITKQLAPSHRLRQRTDPRDMERTRRDVEKKRPGASDLGNY